MNNKLPPKAGSSAPSAADSPAEPTPASGEFELTLEDTLVQNRRVSGPKTVSDPLAGYNPYDMPLNVPGPTQAAKPNQEKRKPTDLRKLSEWIRLQRQVEALKKEKPDSK